MVLAAQGPAPLHCRVMATVSVDPSATVLWSLLLEVVVIPLREGVPMMRSLRVTRMMHWFLSQPVGVQSASAKRKFVISTLRRRHDELRDGYHGQKDMLLVLNQKSSKVSLLDQGKPFIASTCVQVAEPPPFQQ